MTFYFFDLETSGFSARDDRIMQFAGQRTDMDLNPIGEPDNILVKMTADVLPQPEAVLVHGITPQKTLLEGISEGALVNEKTPFRSLSLGKGSVTLMPRGKPFRLRNKSSVTVEFRVIEIRR